MVISRKATNQVPIFKVSVGEQALEDHVSDAIYKALWEIGLILENLKKENDTLKSLILGWKQKSKLGTFYVCAKKVLLFYSNSMQLPKITPAL